jgi:hypothetical protein
MKWSVAAIFALIIHVSFAQQSESQLWMETGVKCNLNKKTDLTFDWTNRIDEFGLVTSFPQISFRYKLLKWLKSSVDYRWVISKDDNGNYSTGNRINANLIANHKFKRLDIGLRARYQYSFNRFVSSNYDPEFDVAYRFRPSISYDINNSIFAPHANVEFFYSPENSPLGNRFTRIRYQIGVELETKLPIDFGIAYLFDQKINLPNAVNKHVLNLSATYIFKRSESKKTKQKGKNLRDL